MTTREPFTRDELRYALGELCDVLEEWEVIIECEEDDEGFPVGDSDAANMKRLLSDATGRLSRIMFNLVIRGMRAEPPVSPEDLGLR